MIDTQEPQLFKRLYFDIETSPNVVFSWNIGYNLNINHENIIKERAIICICYKWEHEDIVRSLSWNKGDDKEMLETFAKVINEADEVLGHNSSEYDVKWLRTRCLLYDIPLVPDINSLDTLKVARKYFRFNSNKLDYIGQFLGEGQKISHGGFNLWKRIVIDNEEGAMLEMLKYCQQDVLLLERIYNRISPYILHKTHRALYEDGNICDCPECSSSKTISNGTRITSSGIIKRRLQCMECGKYFSINETAYKKVKDGIFEPEEQED